MAVNTGLQPIYAVAVPLTQSRDPGCGMDGKQPKLIQKDVASVAEGHTFISIRKDAGCAMAELGLVLRGDDWVNFN